MQVYVFAIRSEFERYCSVQTAVMAKHSSGTVVLPPATSHTAWNSTGRLAVALQNGSLQVWDSHQTAPSSQWQAHGSPIVKVVWAPSEFGFVLASCTADGSVSLWEELCSSKCLVVLLPLMFRAPLPTTAASCRGRRKERLVIGVPASGSTNPCSGP